MTITNVLDSLQQSLTGGDRSLAFRSDSEFTSTLTLGQILKGKVMRHYEGGRYGVSFDGRERVVDSSLPLKTGEVLYGRVIAIDEKVHLQRLARSGQADVNIDGAPKPPPATAGQGEVAALFAQHQLTLPPGAERQLKQLQQQLKSPQVLTSALLTQKLGLPLDPDLVRAVHRVLTGPETGKTRLTQFQGPAITAAPGFSGAQLAAALAPLLAQLIDFSSRQQTHRETRSKDGAEARPPAVFLSTDEPAGAGAGRGEQEWRLGHWVLNGQTESSVAHRLLHLPVWFGDELIEVSLALFSQTATGQQTPGAAPHTDALQYRKVVLSLQTDNLGHIDILARVADRHLRLEVTAAQAGAAEFLAERLTPLEAALRERGWTVDEVCYQSGNAETGVVRSVVEHYVTQDSLSQLM